MSIFDDSDRLAQWNQNFMMFAGGMAVNYWIDKGIVKVTSRAGGPIATGIAIWHVVNWIGLSASVAVDPDKGAVRWANYIASPLQKISPGKDTIISNVLDAVPTSSVANQTFRDFARVSSPGGPWFRTIMGAYGSDVY